MSDRLQLTEAEHAVMLKLFCRMSREQFVMFGMTFNEYDTLLKWWANDKGPLGDLSAEELLNEKYAGEDFAAEPAARDEDYQTVANELRAIGCQSGMHNIVPAITSALSRLADKLDAIDDDLENTAMPGSSFQSLGM